MLFSIIKILAIYLIYRPFSNNFYGCNKLRMLIVVIIRSIPTNESKQSSNQDDF